MNIKDLISRTTFEEVMSIISIHYGDKELNEQRQLYNKLKGLSANPNVRGTTIFINAILSNEEEDVCLSEFDELDFNLCFDVSAYEKEDETVYSIANAGYKDLLGYYVDEETKNKFSEESILAHVLWEVTAYSYDDFEETE